MGAHLYNKFRKGTGLRLIRASWLNKVANLWNFAQGGHLINCDIPDNPGPDRGPRWDLDVDALDSELEARGFTKTVSAAKLAPNKVNTKNADADDDSEEDVAAFAPLAPYGSSDYEASGESYAFKRARIGTSSRAARADHSHPFVDYPANKIRVVVGQDDSGRDLYKTLQYMYSHGELGGDGEGFVAPTEYEGSASGNIVSWIPGTDGGEGTLIFTEKISKDAVEGLSDSLGEIQSALNRINPVDPEAIANDVMGKIEDDIESIKGEITEAAQKAAEEAAGDAIDEYSSQLGSQIQDALDAASELETKISVFSNVDELIEQFNRETSLDAYLKSEDAANTYATKEELESAAENIEQALGSIEAIEGDISALDEWSLSIDDWAASVDSDLDEIFAELDEIDLENYVTKDGVQTITGTKTFTNNVIVSSDGKTSYFVIENRTANTRGYFGLGEVWLDRNSGSIPINFRNISRTVLGQIYYSHSDGNIHIHARPTTGSGYKANGVVLDAATTDLSATDSKAVPTMGWVNDKFLRIDKVGVSGGAASYSHTHSGYATTSALSDVERNANSALTAANKASTEAASAATQSESALDACSQLAEIVNSFNDNYVSKDALTQELSYYSNSDDISNTYCKKTDFDQKVAEIEADIDECLTKDEIPQDFIAAIASKRSGEFTFITDIQFDGTNLQKKTQKITVNNGLITNIPSASAWSTWHTPTVISWS